LPAGRDQQLRPAVAISHQKTARKGGDDLVGLY